MIRAILRSKGIRSDEDLDDGTGRSSGAASRLEEPRFPSHVGDTFSKFAHLLSLGATCQSPL
jgi:hypothetical protein